MTYKNLMFSELPFWKKNVQTYVEKNQTWKYHLYGLEKILKMNKRRAFKKAVGLGKKSKNNKRRAYVYSGV